MHFPGGLKTKNRKKYPEEKILSVNFMYSRHKPGSEWRVGEDFPDFSKIKSDQSFNWSAFSIPVWVRFNDRMELLHDYGVIRVSVKTIKNYHLYNSNLPRKNVGLKHKPLEFNYSHCELYCNSLTKIQRREFRMLLKHNCQKKILPNQQISRITNILEYFIMWRHRILVLLKK